MIISGLTRRCGPEAKTPRKGRPGRPACHWTPRPFGSGELQDHDHQDDDDQHTDNGADNSSIHGSPSSPAPDVALTSRVEPMKQPRVYNVNSIPDYETTANWPSCCEWGSRGPSQPLLAGGHTAEPDRCGDHRQDEHPERMPPNPETAPDEQDQPDGHEGDHSPQRCHEASSEKEDRHRRESGQGETTEQVGQDRRAGRYRAAVRHARIIADRLRFGARTSQFALTQGFLRPTRDRGNGDISTRQRG